MFRIAKQKAKKLLNRYPKHICQQEFESQSFTRFNERPVEYTFIFRVLSTLYPKTILDVGTGNTPLPYMMSNCGSLVTAIDNVRDYWPSDMVNRHFHVIDDDITDTKLSGSFDLITCISVLEHIHKPDQAMRNMFKLLKSGGHLILTFPYNEREYVRNVYELENSGYGRDVAYITQAFSRAELDSWLQDNGGSIVEQEFWQFWSGKHWTEGNQIIPPNQVTADDSHQLLCVLIRKNSLSH